MTIYVDLIILSNFLLDYSLITYTGIITKDKFKWWRICLATIFAVLGVGLIFIRVLWIFFLIRVIWSILIILIAFKYSTIKQFIIKIIVFYLLNYLTAGIIISYNFNFINNSILIDLNNNTTWYILVFSFILANIITYIYKKMIESNAYSKENIIDVHFKLLNFDYIAKGLIDSGNVVHLPDNTPVVFIDKDILNFEINEDFLIKHNIKFTYIQFKTIMNSSISIAFKPEKFSVNYNNKFHDKDVYLAIGNNLKNKDQSFNVILNASIVN